MNNMGVTDLRLVNPLLDPFSEKARVLAVNSLDILEGARRCETMKEAIADCQRVIAATARVRSHMPHNSLWNLGKVLESFSFRDVPTALVFGRETSGLNNEELTLCTDLVYIPTFGNTKSLNLSKAVMVFLYELSRHYYSEETMPMSERERAPAGKVEDLKDHVLRALMRTQFAETYDESYLRRSISASLSGMALAEKDTRLMHKIIAEFEKYLD